MNEDWELLISFFPSDWEKSAFESGAMTRMRKLKSPEALLRTLWLHVGEGYSLRETVARAKDADIADFSDVALLKRLKKSGDWFYLMCLTLLEEQGIRIQESKKLRQDSGLYSNSNANIRLFDAVNVKEPGRTGSSWKLYYSINLSSLICDFFSLSELKDNTESAFHYSVQKNDYIIINKSPGRQQYIENIAAGPAFVIFEVNHKMSAASPFAICDQGIYTQDHKKFPLLEAVQSLKKAGQVKSWDAVFYESGCKHEQLKGRLCVVRKSETAIKSALSRYDNNDNSCNPNTISLEQETPIPTELHEFAKYIIVFTTFPKEKFSSLEVLKWYGLSRQLRPTLKRFKELAQIGHLPKYDDESSKSWFYGKLFVALIMEKMQRYADFGPPWGYEL